MRLSAPMTWRWRLQASGGARRTRGSDPGHRLETVADSRRGSTTVSGQPAGIDGDAAEPRAGAAPSVPSPPPDAGPPGATDACRDSSTGPRARPARSSAGPLRRPRTGTSTRWADREFATRILATETAMAVVDVIRQDEMSRLGTCADATAAALSSTSPQPLQRFWLDPPAAKLQRRRRLPRPARRLGVEIRRFTESS